jgi:Tol biopolymer transport system component
MIMRPDGSDRHELPGRPVWSADDGTLAVLGGDGQLLVGRGDGTGLRPIGSFPLPAAWAPDGSEFVFVRDGDAWLGRADGSQVRNLTGFDLGGVTGAWWSPGGDWIAVLQGTTMWAFSPDGSIRQRLGPHLGPSAGSWGPAWAPVWSPDGTWLAIEHDDPTAAAGSGQEDVTLVHAGDWRAVRLANAWQPAWSLDGRHLAVVSTVGGGYVADVVEADGTGRTTVFAGLPYPPLGWLD